MPSEFCHQLKANKHKPQKRSGGRRGDPKFATIHAELSDILKSNIRYKLKIVLYCGNQ